MCTTGFVYEVCVNTGRNDHPSYDANARRGGGGGGGGEGSMCSIELYLITLYTRRMDQLEIYSGIDSHFQLGDSDINVYSRWDSLLK